MSKYMVAVCNRYSFSNEIRMVTAASTLEAAMRAIGWSDVNLEEATFETLDELLEWSCQNGEIISKPLEVKL